MKKSLLILLAILGVNLNSANANPNLNKTISELRYEVTAIEFTAKDKLKTSREILEKAKNLTKENPTNSDAYLWYGIALSVNAKHEKAESLSTALEVIREAKDNLEKSIELNPEAEEGRAYSTLGMIYAKAPVWPISFGSNSKAEENFKKAIAIGPNNMDNNYRWGEFLMKQGEVEEGKKYLTKALNMPNRKSRKEDAFKKQDIKKILKG